jgi:hypothetical protein
MTDRLLQLLHNLPQATLDPSRAARIRARCHAALAHRPHRDSIWSDAADFWAPMAAGFGGIYLTAVLRQVLVAYGL